MIGQFLLAFREAFEAALVVAVIFAYLKRTRRDYLSRYVSYGIYLAVVTSLVCGTFVWLAYGSLSGPAKSLFEGLAALLAVLVLTSMIYWMATKGRELRAEIERRVETAVTRGATLALVSLSFLVVFREGVESVLFLIPFLLEDSAGTLLGASLGVLASTLLAYVVFVAGMRISIRGFFYYTSVLLVLLAGGLAGYGIHELLEYFEEVGVKTGWFGELAFDLNVPSDSPMHHKGLVGSVFAVIFGYTVAAEWARVIVHLTYLAIALPLLLYVYRYRDKEAKMRRFEAKEHEPTAQM